MNQKPSGVMPRCYMVKKGAPRDNTDPTPGSPTEASVAPPAYRPPNESQANTEIGQNADTAVEYAELRSAPISERSAADTEAAHELLSLAAGLPPLRPATLVTMLGPPEPIVPVYTYTLQPTTIYFVSDDPPEPVYHAVQSLPMQQIEFIDHPPVNFVGYPEGLPPLPPQYNPSQPQPLYHSPPPQPQLQHGLQHGLQTVLIDTEPSVQPATLTTLTIEEVTAQSEPDQISVHFPVIKPVSHPVHAQVQATQPPFPQDLDDDSDEGNLCIVTVKEKEKIKYHCNECGKAYATSSNLSRHKQTHRSLDSNEAKKCDECGKAYVSMPALAMHVLTHRMRHVCGVCGKLFSRPWLLRGHLRSHTGEKPYNCASCGKAFADRSNLRAHRQTHASDKKYECRRCNKNFALKSYLNKHMEAACTRADDEGAAA